jgi:hypothetical protein
MRRCLIPVDQDRRSQVDDLHLADLTRCCGRCTSTHRIAVVEMAKILRVRTRNREGLRPLMTDLARLSAGTGDKPERSGESDDRNEESRRNERALATELKERAKFCHRKKRSEGGERWSF